MKKHNPWAGVLVPKSDLGDPQRIGFCQRIADAWHLWRVLRLPLRTALSLAFRR